MNAAFVLLERLGAIDAGRLTAIGTQVHQLPIHPRLARMLIAANGAREMAQACALLSEAHFIPARSASTTSDLLSAIDGWRNVPPHVHVVAREIEALAQRARVDLRASPGGQSFQSHPVPGVHGPPAPRSGGDDSHTRDDAAFRRGILAGYPDRVAQRREPGSPRVRLASGAGAAIGPESGVRDGEFLVAIDVQSGPVGGLQNVPRGSPNAPNEARIRVASRVERDWLQPTHSELVHRFDRAAGVVRAWTVNRYGALTLAEHPTKADPEIKARLLAEAWFERGPRGDDEQLLRRVRFAGRLTTVEQLVHAAAQSAASLDDVRLARAVSPDLARALDREAPQSLPVPSGRTVRLDYGDDGSVTAAVKLQELFGLAETPRVGSSHTPVVFSLLGAQWTAGPGDTRPSQLLGTHLPASAKGIEGPLSQASVAGGSVDGHADGAFLPPATATIVNAEERRRLMTAEASLLLVQLVVDRLNRRLEAHRFEARVFAEVQRRDGIVDALAGLLRGFCLRQ